MNETLRTVDGRAVLRMQRRLAHPATKVWRALTDPTELSQWFPATVTLELAVGAMVSFDFGDGPRPGGKLLELDPPRVFAFSLDDTVLRFELTPDGDGTLLTFTHTFDDRPAAASYAAGWRGCFDMLEAMLAGAAVSPVRPSAELHDSYVEAFGLDTGIVADAGDGWRIQFERQLTRPAETVWAMLATDTPAVGAPAPASATPGRLASGPVTRVQAPQLLEYEWHHAGRPAGHVRWELSDTRGTGHGARLLLTQTGPDELANEQADALSAWRDHLHGLAQRLR